jgi:hypothetical protein
MNLLTFVFLLALVSASEYYYEDDYEDYGDFTHHEVISAYCQLVQDQKFYLYYNLRERCGLVVRIYGKKVCFTRLLRKGRAIVFVG